MFFCLYDEKSDNKQHCYYFETNCELDEITDNELTFVYDILKIKQKFSAVCDFSPSSSIEIGFHFNYESPWCSNVLSIFRKNKINFIVRIERTTIIHKSLFDWNRVDLKLH